jgi:hypothetical protein
MFSQISDTALFLTHSRKLQKQYYAAKNMASSYFANGLHSVCFFITTMVRFFDAKSKIKLTIHRKKYHSSLVLVFKIKFKSPGI